MPHYAPTIDYEHEGRVLAERRRVGPGYIFDLNERARARRKAAAKGKGVRRG